MDLEKYRGLAKFRLSTQRREHSLGVAKLARELAERHGADPLKAEAAGLLHDLMKEEPVSRLLQIIRASAIMKDKPLPEEPGVYHAMAGYLFARDELGIGDSDLLNAIRYHTTGRENMSPLEKTVFAADKFSYDRAYQEIERYRALAFSDLNASLLAFFDFSFQKRLRQKRIFDLDSIRCYNWLCVKSREK